MRHDTSRLHSICGNNIYRISGHSGALKVTTVSHTSSPICSVTYIVRVAVFFFDSTSGYRVGAVQRGTGRRGSSLLYTDSFSKTIVIYDELDRCFLSFGE